MLRRGARGGLGSGSFSPPPEVEGVRKTLQRDPCTTEAGLEMAGRSTWDFGASIFSCPNGIGLSKWVIFGMDSVCRMIYKLGIFHISIHWRVTTK